MGVWPGSTGRLGGSQPHAAQPVFRSFAGPGFISTRTKTDGIGLFTGQVGYAWNAALFYVKGGAAVTSNRFSVLETLTGIELASASATRWGGTAGVGFEYGFTPNWSFGVEYNHLWMGDANNSFTGLNLLPPLLSTIGSPKTWTWSPCASTIASAVTAHPSQRDTDLALFRLLQQTRPAEMPAFLLEVTCLRNPSGPRAARKRSPRQAAADRINQAFKKSISPKFVMPSAPPPAMMGVVSDRVDTHRLRRRVSRPYERCSRTRLRRSLQRLMLQPGNLGTIGKASGGARNNKQMRPLFARTNPI